MKRSRHGFTLVELIIVIAVIGILAAILIPVFSNVIRKANEKSALSDARNTVEQYMIDAAENPNLPKDIVLFIEKGGELYLFGYDRTKGGEIKVANNGHAICDAEGDEPWRAVMTDFSFNEKGTDTNEEGILEPDQEKDYTEEDQGIFWMVPYSAPQPDASQVKGFHQTKEETETYPTYHVDSRNVDETYHNLSKEMSTTMGEEKELVVFHAILLPGTFTIESTGGNGGGSDTPTPEPEPEVKHTVTLKMGELAGKNVTINDSSVTPVIEKDTYTVEMTDGAAFLYSSYMPSWSRSADDHAVYTCVGWKADDGTELKAGSSAYFITRDDVEMTAIWEKIDDEYLLSFNANGGTLKGVPGEFEVSGQLASKEFIYGTNVHDIIAAVSAENAPDVFLGWSDGDTLYDEAYLNSHSTIMLTNNMPLTAVWEKYYKVTLYNEDGTSNTVYGTYKPGDDVQLPKYETIFGELSGARFDRWVERQDGDRIAEDGHYRMPATGRNVIFDATTITTATLTYYSEYYNGNQVLTKIEEHTYDINTVIPELPYTVDSKYSKPDDAATGATYRFVGWVCGSDEYGVEVDAEGNATGGYKNLTVTKNMDLTAKFEPWFHISFLAGDYEGAAADLHLPTGMTVQENYSFNLADYSNASSIYTGSDYNFLGWKLNNTGSTLTSGNYSINHSLSFTAQWEELITTKTYTATVTLHDKFNDDKDCGTQTVSVTVDKSVTKFTITSANIGEYVTGNYKIFDSDKQYFDTNIELTLSGSTFTPTTWNIYEYNSSNQILTRTATGVVNIGGGSTGASASGMDKKYILMNNLDTSPGWLGSISPIGWMNSGNDEAVEFTGEFDGNGMKLAYQVLKNKNTAECVGLFAINGGTIKNFTVTQAYATEGNSDVGLIAGQNEGTITNITVNSTAYIRAGYHGGGTTDGDCLGGICGFNAVGGVISYCTVNQSGSTGYIKGDTHVGGIAGLNNGTISDCTYTNSYYASGASISGYGIIGGITGENRGDGSANTGVIKRCTVSNATLLPDYSFNLTQTDYIAAAMTGTFVGGIAGMNYYDSTIKNCTVGSAPSISSVGSGLTNLTVFIGRLKNDSSLSSSATGFQGGAVGINRGNITSVSVNRAAVGAYNMTASTIPETYGYVGGIIGFNGGTVQYCYNLDSGTGAYGSIGGLVGSQASNTSSKTLNCAYIGRGITYTTTTYTQLWIGTSTKTGVGRNIVVFASVTSETAALQNTSANFSDIYYESASLLKGTSSKVKTRCDSSGTYWTYYSSYFPILKVLDN